MREPIHFSRLKEARKSAAHLFAALNRTEHHDTPAMLTGRVVHSFWLEGIEPIVYPGERRGKAWQEFKRSKPRRHRDGDRSRDDPPHRGRPEQVCRGGKS